MCVCSHVCRARVFSIAQVGSSPSGRLEDQALSPTRTKKQGLSHPTDAEVFAPEIRPFLIFLWSPQQSLPARILPTSAGFHPTSPKAGGTSSDLSSPPNPLPSVAQSEKEKQIPAAGSHEPVCNLLQVPKGFR